MVHVGVTAAPAADWRLAVVLVVMVALAVATSRIAGLGVERQQVVAAVRAIGQLALVALVIAAVLSSLAWSLAFVALMFAVATFTAHRRLRVPPRQVPWMALPMVAGAGPVIAICMGSGVVPLNGVGLIPIAGIIIGNTMTAASIAGRRAFDELAQQVGTYEAGLALGMRSPDAALLVIGPTASEALVPGLDQTAHRRAGHPARCIRRRAPGRGYAARGRRRPDPRARRTARCSGDHHGVGDPRRCPWTPGAAGPGGTLSALTADPLA